MMVNSLTERLNNQLHPGESILWMGQPQSGLLWRRSDWLLLPLSIILCGLACWLEGWIIILLVEAAPILNDSLGLFLFLGLLFFAMLCLPLVLVGLFLMIGRFFFDRMRRSRTLYAVTNQRVLIATFILKQRVKTVPLDKKVNLRLEINKSDRGSIYLSVDAFLWWILMGPPWWLPFWPDVEVYQPPFLERIEKPAEVYEILKKVLSGGV